MVLGNTIDDRKDGIDFDVTGIDNQFRSKEKAALSDNRSVVNSNISDIESGINIKAEDDIGHSNLEDMDSENKHFSQINPGHLEVHYYQSEQNVEYALSDKYLRRDDKIRVGPFIKGDGVTIGNMIRRKLISGIPSIRIFAMFSTVFNHEYDSFHGVKEDVSAVILNLKEVVIKNKDNKYINIAAQARIVKKGKGVILAGDLEIDHPHIEVVNKNQVICTVVADVDIDVILYMRSGHGYVTSNDHRMYYPIYNNIDEKKENVIYFDVSYNRVSANFHVNDFIPPQDSDIVIKYEKLEEVILDINTDGSITTKEAFGLAIKMISEQVSSIAGFVNMSFSNSARRSTVNMINLLNEKLEENAIFKKCHRLVKALTREGYMQIIDVVKLTPNTIATMSRLGKKTANEFERIMRELGFELFKHADEYIWELKNY